MRPVIASCLMMVTLLFYTLLAIRPVTIEVTPRVAFAPTAVIVTVRVQPNPENRHLIVEAEGGDYRRSDVQLEGEFAPIQHQIQWRALDVGDYVVSASIVSKTALLARATTRVVVH